MSGVPGTDDGAGSLRDRLLALRDRLLQDRRFQRWAARFPLTRAIANRRATALFDIAAGFVYAQVLKACIELDLFARVERGPVPLARLAADTGLGVDALERLLQAAASLRLLQPRSNGTWGLGAHGAALLGNPGISAMVVHHALFYADLADPVGLLRDRDGARLAGFWGYAAAPQPTALNGTDVAAYSALMADSQALVAEDILDSFSMRAYRSLLDVAGGEGVFATHVARRWSAIRVEVLDLPAVAERAASRFAQSGVSDRVSAHGGDMCDLSAYRDRELISLVRVLHDHDDARASCLLRACHAALAPGGVLLIAEPMAQTRGSEAVADAYFGLYLWAMGSGKARSPARIRALLQEAGFHAVREVRTPRPPLMRLLVAHP